MFPTTWTYQSVRLVEVCELVLLIRTPALSPWSLLSDTEPRRAVQSPQRSSDARSPVRLHYSNEVTHGRRQLSSNEQTQESHHITDCN